MGENKANEKKSKVKTFFKGFFEKLDKKMGEKAKSRPCCSKPYGKEKDSCCS